MGLGPAVALRLFGGPADRDNSVLKIDVLPPQGGDLAKPCAGENDAARVWADREAALDPADPKPYAHEYRVQRRDGEIRWVEAHGLAYFEGSGRERRPVSFIGTVQDITERKQHEEREHLLMREVNHRAKNMLSVVDAIAHQTAARNPEDFVERFSDRIQGPADVPPLVEAF